MRMNELLKKRRKDIEKIGYFIHLPLFSFSKNNGQLIMDNGQFSPFVGAGKKIGRTPRSAPTSISLSIVNSQLSIENYHSVIGSGYSTTNGLPPS